MKSDINLSLKLDYMRQIYKKIVVLAGISHLVYLFIFFVINANVLAYYNIFSVMFYISMVIIIHKRYYRSALLLIHGEVVLYSIITTLFLGIQTGFTLYLFCIATLVYFSPFKKKTTIYYLAILEVGIFVILTLFSCYGPTIPFAIQLSKELRVVMYLINAISSFVVVLYTAFLSNVSANVEKQDLMIQNDDLHSLANHDELTGLLNRRYFEDELRELWKKAKNGGEDFTFVMADIDNFKNVNDTYGHAYGDKVLYNVAEIMKNTLKNKASVCRWGGEEFVLLFENATKTSVYDEIVNLKNVISNNYINVNKEEIFITVTFGISDSSETEEMKKVLRIADARMYYGKRIGKNCVVIENVNS